MLFTLCLLPLLLPTPQSEGRHTALLDACRALQVRLQAPALPGPDPRTLLARLYTLTQAASEEHVDRRGARVTLDSDAATLFEVPPVLPPETKEGTRWVFQTTHLEVVPRHLFIYALRIKGDHTLRLRSVTLTFADGTRLVYDAWADLEDGNGRAFSRRGFGPPLAAYGPDEAPRARALRAVDILGSAQDGTASAALTFRFTLPDPSDRPYEQALQAMESLTRLWADTPPQASRDAARIEALYRALDEAP